MALGIASATLFAIGWACAQRYVPLLFAAAPVVALAGLVSFADIALRRDQQATVPALIGCVLALPPEPGFARREAHDDQTVRRDVERPAS